MFQKLFSGKMASSTRFERQSQPPRPYCLAVDEASAEPGETLYFTITLFGTAIKYLPYFITAVTLLGETGISRKRSRFSLEKVNSLSHGQTTEDCCIFDQAGGTAKDILHATTFDTATIKASTIHLPDDFSIAFQSPTMLAAGERNSKAAPFFVELMRSILRRYSDLSELYGGGRPNLPYGEILNSATTITTNTQSVIHHKLRLWSTRKGAPTPLEGFTGEVEYSGRVDPFIPYILLGEWIQVGKQTTFGMGRMRLLNQTG